MNPALVCGVVPLAFLVGILVIRGWRSAATTRIGFDHVVTAIALGVVLLTPVFLLCVHVELFVPVAIGGFGWLGFTLWTFARRHTRWHLHVGVPEALVILGAIAFLIVAINGRDEPWTAGRDQQVYAEFAVLLADTGKSTIGVEPQDAADADLLRAVGTDPEVNRYLGVTRSLRGAVLDQASYLPLGWPAWLAFAYAAGGYPALHAANALVFALGAMLLRPVLRRVVGRSLATAAVLTLLALPSSLWIAGVSLSEPLAMVCWLGIMALFALRAEHGRRWVPVAVFAAAMVRIDALLLVPALIVAHFADASLGGSESAVWRTRRFAAESILSLGAAVAWYARFKAPYLDNVIGYIVSIAGASLLAACVTAGGTSWYRLARRVLASRVVAVGFAVVVVALATYALLVRPNLQPFSIIHNGTGLDGTRDYREDSLRNLAIYVGWPLLLLAIAGAAIGMIRFARRATPMAERVLLVTGLAFVALYLWAPLVSPDHPWAIRRFVPVVIPMTVVLAALALRTITRRRIGSRTVAAGVLMVGAAAESALAYGTPLLTLRENRGASALVTAVETALPNAMVVCDLQAGNMGIVLSIARRRDVVVADFGKAEHRVAVGRWLAAKAREGKPAWLLEGQRVLKGGAQIDRVGEWHFVRRVLLRTLRPPAHIVTSETVDMALLRVDGLDKNVAFEGFGGTPVWGISDSGFFAPVTTRFGTIRMTNGAASLDVPSALLRDATALEFEWFSWAPYGESRETLVRIGDEPVWHGALVSGVSKIVVPLSLPLQEGIVHIRIESTTFDTRALDPADYRGRVGIGVIVIRALHKAIARSADRGHGSGIEPRSALDAAATSAPHAHTP